MENKLFAYFDFNPTKAYPIVYGATYTETFNEEINSFNIMIDMVKAEDRLYFDRPYHFVKIVNDIPNGESGLLFNGKNSIIMLVDTFEEALNSIGGEPFYRYKMQLMNCVKLLEKVQCPNLMITHSLVTGKNEPIYVYIDRYMQLYCPKVKMSTDGETWSYEYLLKWDNICGIHNPNYDVDDPTSQEWIVEPDPIFDVPCADMQMSEPTLRQVLTSLMSQVACIPSLNYRTLTYINFREEAGTIVVNDSDGINFINQSGASDSYANNLISSPSQILNLSDKNSTIADIVGFRDSDNAVISQTQNLQLEVRYPIYKINRVRMRTTDNKQGWFVPAGQVPGKSTPFIRGPAVKNTDFDIDYWPTLIDYGLTEDNKRQWGVKINFTYYQPTSNLHFFKGMLKNVKIHFCKYHPVSGDQEWYYEEVITKDIEASWELSLGDNSLNNDIAINSDIGFAILENGYVSQESSMYRTHISNNGVSCNYQLRIMVSTDNTSTYFGDTADYMWLEYDFENYVSQGTEHNFVTLSKITLDGLHFEICNYIYSGILMLDSSLRTKPITSYSTIYTSSNGSVPMLRMSIPANIGTYIDITPCIVENNKRRLLDTNYLSMLQDVVYEDSSELSDLAKYVYGTMGYSIGGKTITGFSNTYSRAQAWWNITASYFNTILTFINARKSRLQQFDYDEFIKAEKKQYDDYKSKIGYGLLRDENVAECFYIDISGSNWGTNYNKMKFLFYIEYQPLNNLKYKATKEEKNIPLEIQQLNQSADGLSDFERVVNNLQDVTNRIGNPVKILPQTVDDINKIKPLNSIYNDGYYDFTVFHRQFSIYEKYLSVNYTASEKYVIKNYFTSIITKYRAYQYVDYNAAIVRKDNLKVYALLSDKNYYDGDDKVIFFNRFYTLEDLQKIYGVSNISDIMVEDENHNFTIEYKYFSYIEVGFGRYMAFPLGYDNQGTFSDNISVGMNIDDFSQYDITEYGLPEYNETIWYGKYYLMWQADSFSSTVFGSNLAYYFNIFKTEFRRFLNETYESELGGSDYITPSSVSLLIKMNGSYLKIGDKYYQIEFGEYQQGTLLLESGPLSNNDFMLDIFTKTNKRIQNVIPKSSKLDFYPNRNFALSIRRHLSILRLNLITDEWKLQTIKQDNLVKSTLLLSGLEKYRSVYTYNPRYVIKSSINDNNAIEETKNEVNLLVGSKGFAINYQDYDNVSAGPMLLTLEPSQATLVEIPEGVGGYIQKWQVWNQEIYGKSHQVFITYQINIKPGTANIDNYIAQLPVITSGWEYQPYTLFQIVDDNKSNDLNLTFYKDNAEIINQTLQIEYYSNPDIIIGQNFIQHSRLINKLDFADTDEIVCFDITGLKFKLQDLSYNTNLENYIPVIGVEYDEDEDAFINNPPYKIGYEESLSKPYIEIYWDQIPPSVLQIKFSLISNFSYLENDNDEIEYYCSDCRDLMAFKREKRTNSTRYYLTMNDSKTNDVWYFAQEDDLFITTPALNGVARNIKNAPPAVVFNINQTDFNRGENDSYSFTVANNNPHSVELHISGLQTTYTIAANSSITLLSTTDLDDTFDNVVEYRLSNITCYFTGEGLTSDTVIMLKAIEYVNSPIIYVGPDPAHGIYVHFTNNNPCTVKLYCSGSSSSSTYETEIPAGETLVLTNDDMSPYYDQSFANSIYSHWSAFIQGYLEDDYICYFYDYDNNLRSNNVIILSTTPIAPIIHNYIEETGGHYSMQILNNNIYDVYLYAIPNDGGASIYLGMVGGDRYVEISDGTFTALDNYYVEHDNGTLTCDVLLYFTSETDTSEEVLLWEADE